MAGKPAARVGDPTAHGGTIAPPGAPTVLIGGMPAAKMGDMHICPMLNPGTPPPPHVGGQIMATGATVLICGQPAARVGDTAICQGPPATIVMGCPTVLIGDGGGGGGGAAGSGSGNPASEKTSAGKVEEGHYLDVKFQDKGGKPIAGVAYTVKAPDNKKTDGTLTGQVNKTGLKQGNYEIALKAVTNAQWSVKKAQVGDRIKLTAEVSGFDSGAEATFRIFEKDISSADDLIDSITVKTKGSKAEAEWVYEYVDDSDDDPAGQNTPTAYSMPQYYFTVQVGNAIGRSDLLEFKDYIEINLKDVKGKPIGNAKYRVFFDNGEVKEGTLDSNGYKKVDKVPPGKWRVEFPEAGHVTKSSS